MNPIDTKLPKYIVVAHGETDHPELAIVDTPEAAADAVLALMFDDPADCPPGQRADILKDFDDTDEWPWSITFEIGGISVTRMHVRDDIKRERVATAVAFYECYDHERDVIVTPFLSSKRNMGYRRRLMAWAYASPSAANTATANTASPSLNPASNQSSAPFAKIDMAFPHEQKIYKPFDIHQEVYVNIGACTVKKGTVSGTRTTIMEDIFRLEYQVTWLVSYGRALPSEWFEEIDVRLTADEAFHPLEK